MSIFCKLFGHRFKPTDYGTLSGNYVDGIGRIYTHVYMQCERCSQNVQVCKVHLPSADLKALNLSDPDVEKYIANFYHNRLEDAKFDVEYAKFDAQQVEIGPYLQPFVLVANENGEFDVANEHYGTFDTRSPDATVDIAPVKKPRKPRKKKTAA
jgi:hypothetical protein